MYYCYLNLLLSQEEFKNLYSGNIIILNFIISYTIVKLRSVVKNNSQI